MGFFFVVHLSNCVQLQAIVARDVCFCEAEIETVRAVAAIPSLVALVEHRSRGDAAVAFVGDGPGPASSVLRVAFGWKSFGSERCVDFAQEWAEDGNTLNENGTGDFGGVPNVGDTVAPYMLLALTSDMMRKTYNNREDHACCLRLSRPRGLQPRQQLCLLSDPATIDFICHIYLHYSETHRNAEANLLALLHIQFPGDPPREQSEDEIHDDVVYC